MQHSFQLMLTPIHVAIFFDKDYILILKFRLKMCYVCVCCVFCIKKPECLSYYVQNNAQLVTHISLFINTRYVLKFITNKGFYLFLYF